MATKKLTPEERRADLMEHLHQMFGKGSAGAVSEVIIDPVIIPTEFDILNFQVLGIGGIPEGIIVEMYGPEAGGKGWLSTKICAATQRQGKKCLWFDIERQANSDWMEKLGVNIDEMDIIQAATSAEETFELLKRAISTQRYSLIVIDSVATMQPKIDQEKPVGENQVGRLAMIMADGLRPIVNLAKDNNCTVIFINQTREKIGKWGNPETTPGGKSLAFYASIRLRIQKQNSNKVIVNGETIGCHTKVLCIKNRFGPPDAECELPMRFKNFTNTPLDKFIEIATGLKIFTKRKNNEDEEKNWHYGKGKEKISCESPEALVDEIISLVRTQELAESIELKMKEEEFQISDSDVSKVIEKMLDGSFVLENTA